MSEINLPPEVGAYRDALRAYHLRLADWLGIDPEVAFDLNDVDEEAGDHWMRVVFTEVRWKSLDQPHPAMEGPGRAAGSLDMFSDGETITFTNKVNLDPAETARLRTDVGERPEMFTPEQRLMLDGLRWRAEHS